MSRCSYFLISFIRGFHDKDKYSRDEGVVRKGRVDVGSGGRGGNRLFQGRRVFGNYGRAPEFEGGRR